MSDLGNDSTQIKKVIVKSYFFKELAAIYRLSYYQMCNKIKPYKERIGEPRDGYQYDADQVELIFQLIRLPSNVRIIKI